MKVISKRVGADPAVVDMDVSLESLQAYVGGYVEYVIFIRQTNFAADIICNEEGMYAASDGGPLPQNWAGILGDFLVVAIADDNSVRDLTDAEIESVMLYLEYNADVLHPVNQVGENLE